MKERLISSAPFAVKILKRKKTTITSDKAKRFNPTIKSGLTSSQVDQRYDEGLVNITTNQGSKSVLSILIKNTFTFFNLLCLLVFIAYISVGKNDDSMSFSNYIFCIPYIINLFMGIIQEIKAKKSVEKLSILQTPITKVIRDGVQIEIPSPQLVLDDVIVLSTGDQIPIDGEILSGDLEVNESVLTGESIAVKKHETDKIMAGSFVVSGKAYCKVSKIGNESYIQKLSATAKKYKKPHSELMTTLTWLVKIVGILIVPTAIGVGLVNYTYYETSYGQLSTFVVTNTGSVIIGMIPAGLIMLTTLALSLGVIRLYKNNTLVQDMYSLEMLARVDVLCLDKTGTITDGRMKVVNEVMIKEKFPYSLDNIIGNMERVLNDSNQTATALRARYINDQLYSEVKILPFSSSRKFSAVSFNNIGTFALGAPEFILKEVPDNVIQEMQKYQYLGNRVVVLAHSPVMFTGDTLPNTMKCVAIIVLTDNIREDAIETINWFKNNQVKVKVISGDNPITVSEIAKRAGVENASNWISLEGLSDKEVSAVADKYTVFGRVTPDQKAILVRAIKRAGHTVAMTGDGVNDILAMKKADVSITVASGTDATKNIAHIVLADNNFNSIPKVVSEGRRVINNIQQSASLYLMKTIFITFLALISIITSKPFMFESGHLTLLELIIIGLGSFVLSLQPNNKRVEGDFMTTVLSNAIPGAFILLFNVYLVDFLNLMGIFNSSTALITTVKVVLFTFGGSVFLYNLCKPFNAVRIILITFVLLVLSLWFIYLLDTSSWTTKPLFNLMNMFPLTLENWKYFVLIVAVFEFDFPLLSIFIGLNKQVVKIFNGKN